MKQSTSQHGLQQWLISANHINFKQMTGQYKNQKMLYSQDLWHMEYNQITATVYYISTL